MLSIKKIVALLALWLTILVSIPSLTLAQETEQLEQPFQLQGQILSDGRLELRWDIAPKHHLYKDKIKVIDANNHSILELSTLPIGNEINDPVLGKYEVYSDLLVILLPKSAAAANTDLLLTYQGCAEGGFCYLPENKLIHIDNNHTVTITDTDLSEFASESETDHLANTIKNRFLPLTLLIFFGLGLLLAFSPCILPMIPLVVNLIIGPKPISSHKALVLSSSYVIGMAGSYALAGMGAGLIGATLQAWLQRPLILIVMTGFVVLLALAQFDLIRFSLPHFNKKLHHWGQKQLQGSVFGAFILGIISALIVSPCITAPLIGVLTYISQHGNAAVGALTLFCLGLGMGVPLIIVAMLSNMILPAAGPWMNLVKTITGIALLGLAIWIIQRILPTDITLMLWGALCIGTAVFFKAFESVGRKRSAQILKGIGILLAIYGAVLIAGGLNRKCNLFQVSSASKQESGPNWTKISSQQELDQQLSAANGKFSILEVYADWCVNCQRIEQSVFHDPTVMAKLVDFNLLRIDLTTMSPAEQELIQSLKVYGPPAILFFAPNGKEIHDKRVIGELDQAQMLDLMQSLK